jgi:hypothetical protein
MAAEWGKRISLWVEQAAINARFSTLVAAIKADGAAAITWFRAKSIQRLVAREELHWGRRICLTGEEAPTPGAADSFAECRRLHSEITKTETELTNAGSLGVRLKNAPFRQKISNGTKGLYFLCRGKLQCARLRWLARPEERALGNCVLADSSCPPDFTPGKEARDALLAQKAALNSRFDELQSTRRQWNAQLGFDSRLAAGGFLAFLAVSALLIVPIAHRGAKAALAAVPSNASPAVASEISSANAGDKKAMLDLGKRYQSGQGVAQDEHQALDWYQKASDAGNADATEKLAELYARGLGVKQNASQAWTLFRKAADGNSIPAMRVVGYVYEQMGDNIQAEPYLKKAADAGDPMAMCYLGNLYTRDIGSFHNGPLGVQWLTKAGQAGDGLAMNLLGCLYLNGQDVTQDSQQALDWFHKGADAGNKYAMYNIGYAYYSGTGVSKDFGLAMTWYTKAANAGMGEAMNSVGQMYLDGDGVTRDYQQAFNWYGKAADHGCAKAMANIAYMYDQGDYVTQDYQQEMTWYRKAADRGCAVAMTSIGGMYDQGRGVAQDPAQAVQWYQKAANAGDPNGMYNLASCYGHGQGIAQDMDQSKKWLQKSAALGCEQAKEMLAQMGESSGNDVSSDLATAFLQGMLNSQGESSSSNSDNSSDDASRRIAAEQRYDDQQRKNDAENAARDADADAALERLQQNQYFDPNTGGSSYGVDQ